MAFEVPMVDLAPYVGGGTDQQRADVAAAMDRACREVGFAQVVGHGVPSEVTDGLAAAIDAFFGRSLAEKKAWTAPSGVNRGYSAPKSESLSLSLGVESATRMNDFFEAYNVGVQAADFPGLGLDEADYGVNLWPDVPGFRAQVEAYFVEAGRVARTLTTVFADALGLPTGFFDRFTDHSIDVLRMNNYALEPGEIELDGDLTGMGEHTDFGIVTVLWADRVRGLQVLGGRDDDFGWHDVSPAEDALLVNLGDLTARWTNERWLSTLHRVKPPIVDGAVQRRRSAAYFHDGNADALISTLARCVDPEHPDLYAPVTVREHIAAKLAGSRAGRLNTSAVREATRVRAALD